MLANAATRSLLDGTDFGDSAFLDRIASLLGRDPKPGKRGPKMRRQGELSALSPKPSPKS